MFSEESANTGSFENVSGAANMPEKQSTYPQATADAMMSDAMTYRAIYPEIYYKLRPFISVACDMISMYGPNMPTQQQLEHIADGIYDDFCRMYPDMAEYMRSADSALDDPSGDPPERGGFRGGFRPRFRRFFRRRGLGRDFIDALLLSSLLGRRFF